MSSGGRRLFSFFAGLALAFSVLELGCRVFAPVLFETSQRVLFKAATLRRHGPVNVLFLGTSRSAEGVRPSIFDAALAGSALTTPSSFNLGVANSSLDMMAFEADAVADTPGLQLVFLEISEHALTRIPPPWLEPKPPPRGFDEQIWRSIEARSRAVQLRKSLMLDNLGRFAGVLAFARLLDGSEWRGSDYVRAVLGRREEFPQAYARGEWKRRVWPAAAPAAPIVTYASEAALFVAMAGRFQRSGARVIFLVPPVTKAKVAVERTQAFAELLAGVAAAAGAAVWDFSASETPDEMFRDTHHLTVAGATQFTRCLAAGVAEDRHAVQ